MSIDEVAEMIEKLDTDDVLTRESIAIIFDKFQSKCKK